MWKINLKFYTLSPYSFPTCPLRKIANLVIIIPIPIQPYSTNTVFISPLFLKTVQFIQIHPVHPLTFTECASIRLVFGFFIIFMVVV